MLVIKVKNGDINKALKQYKSKVIKTRQMTELRDRKEYTKPSEEKRKQKNKAIYLEKKRREEGRG
jgi:small subunit ribosomal protein S21